MGVVNDLVRHIALPRMARVRQYFDASSVEDVEGAVIGELRASGVLSTIRPGMSVAITAGSRGIANIARIIRTLVQALYAAGAQPFIVPAMGSHGGATAEGQLAVLKSLGITDDAMGCPIRSCMETALIGEANGRPVQIDAFAANAHGIVVVNRVKSHTSFTGRYESGLMKMLAIGVAKQAGAEVCHQEGYGKIADNVALYGRAILRQASVLFGVAVVENAFNQTRLIEAMPAKSIEAREPELLLKAKALAPHLLFENIGVLIVDYMGKNISGLGMDPHVTGSFASPYAKGPERPDKVVVLDLTHETHGNANGVGVADVTTRRLMQKFDPEATYPNALTATLMGAVRMPMVMDNQRLAIQAAVKTASGFDKERIRIVRIQDTLNIGEISISESMLEEAIAHPDVEILSQPEPMAFNAGGDLF